MELFTEIEFKVDEFDKIEKVLSTLTKDGWITIDTKVYKVKKQNNISEVVAKKYYFKRII